jgi:hypothetical protein
LPANQGLDGVVADVFDVAAVGERADPGLSCGEVIFNTSKFAAVAAGEVVGGCRGRLAPVLSVAGDLADTGWTVAVHAVLEGRILDEAGDLEVGEEFGVTDAVGVVVEPSKSPDSAMTFGPRYARSK